MNSCSYKSSCIRGVHSEGYVQLLRKLRSILSDDFPIELQNLGDFNAVDAYETIQKKVVDFENLRKQAKESRPYLARGSRRERVISEIGLLHLVELGKLPPSVSVPVTWSTFLTRTLLNGVCFVYVLLKILMSTWYMCRTARAW
jgi:hypothetical protein